MTTRFDRTFEILDVGHGNCAVAIDGAHVTIIDTGLGSSLLEFLDEKRIEQIARVFVSHADQDHIGGLVALLATKRFRIGCVMLNSDAEKRSKVWDDLVYELSELDRNEAILFSTSLTAGQGGLFYNGGMVIEVLGPSKYMASRGPGSTDREGRTITANAMSAVIRVLDGTRAIAVLAGDIDEIGLDNLLTATESFPAPLLVFPHHGGLPGRANVRNFAARLLNAVRPTTVVFSNGRGRFGTPRPELISAIQATDSRVWIACTQLSELCASHLPRHNPTHLAQAFARGRAHRACCAGTLVLDLNSAELMPIRDGHQAFVREEAPDALCRQGSPIGPGTPT